MLAIKMTYRHVSEIDFTVDSLPRIERPERVLFTTPDHFAVQYVINPHMAGNVGTVDPKVARRQWDALLAAYEEAGVHATAISGVDGLPDMVFCANQTLPFLTPDGRNGVILSRMANPERAGEVDHYKRWFQKNGYEVVQLPESVAGSFEGMGDAIWHPSRYLLWGGYGYRTDSNVYEYITDALGVRVMVLELVDEQFYHLDTCFSPLDEETVLIFPDAFHGDSLEMIRHLFKRVIEAPEDEARELFACNAHAPDGRHVIIQRGCAVTIHRLQEAGFRPVEVDTDEFLKSGGSVFCMKLMYW